MSKAKVESKSKSKVAADVIEEAIESSPMSIEWAEALVGRLCSVVPEMPQVKEFLLRDLGNCAKQLLETIGALLLLNCSELQQKEADYRFLLLKTMSALSRIEKSFPSVFAEAASQVASGVRRARQSIRAKSPLEVYYRAGRLRIREKIQSREDAIARNKPVRKASSGRKNRQAPLFHFR